MLSGILISLWAQDPFREVPSDPRAMADGHQPHTVQEGVEGVIIQMQDYDKFGIWRILVLKSWPVLHQE